MGIFLKFGLSFQFLALPCVCDLCPADEFQCSGVTNECLPMVEVCDGWPECFYGDESNCQDYTCLPGFIKCDDNMVCIKETAICDGNTDCLYGSDELLCDERICPDGFLKCDDNIECLETQYFCDGVIRNDFTFGCQDGSDEGNCSFGMTPTF